MAGVLYSIDTKTRFTFPGPVYRVTGGHGGESLLIRGRDRTVLYDCGMAYCAEKTVTNIRSHTDHLDTILLSHSHYDHIGALPDILKAFPEAEVLGSAKCCSILSRKNARMLMEKLGDEARRLYAPESTKPVTTDGLRADRIIGDGDIIDLGDGTITVYETKGHTDCSLSFMIQPAGLLLTSESTGIMEQEYYIHTPILKSFPQAIESAVKCKALHPEHICLPHAGMIPDSFVPDYFDRFIEECENKKAFVSAMAAECAGSEQVEPESGHFDKMLEKYCRRYWNPVKAAEQPYAAYEINCRHELECLLKWKS